MYECARASVYLCVGKLKGQKRTLDPVDLELYMVVSHLAWVLNPNSGLLQEQQSTLNCWAFSLVPDEFLNLLSLEWDIMYGVRLN